MSILSWLKRPTPAPRRRRLPGRDPRAPGHRRRRADRRRRRSADAPGYAALKEFGNVTLTTEAARRVWTPRWLEALRDLAERRPLRDPRAGQEPGVLAHRRRRAHARHRPERRRLHDAQEHRAHAARRRRRRRRGSPSIFGETSAGRPLRVSYPDYQYLRDHDRAFVGALRLAPASRSTWAAAAAPRQVSGELVTGNYFQVLGVRAAARPHAAAVGRDRARPPSGRRASATGCGGATSAPTPTSSARRSRSTTTR